MKNRILTRSILPLAVAGILLASGCNKQPAPPANNAAQENPPAPPAAPPSQAAAPAPEPPAPMQQPAPAPQAMAPAPAPARTPVALVIPAGTHISVTLNQQLSSKTNQAGDTFSATLANSIRSGGQIVARAGSRATGTVVTSKSLGRFKGQAELAVRLDRIQVGGREYDVETSAVEHVEKGKGKRTAGFIGGGAGLGAIIGGLAGGGKGALIGGLTGAGAGTAGTAFTGNKDIVIPAETTLTFRVERAVSIR